MNKEELSPRLKSIIAILCDRKDFITIGEIAAKLAVSPKTITRELIKVDSLLPRYKAHLEKKQGVGICIKGDIKVIANIKSVFYKAPETVIYQPKERASFLTARLLQNQEPIKFFELAVELNVAESTISTDLDKLESWFISHNLTLIRKPGLGVYISGSEKNIRKAILHYIYENINETDLVEILHNTLAKDTLGKNSINKSSQRLLNLVDTQILAKLESVIHKVELDCQFKLPDNAYVGLLIHLALAIQRMRQNEKITFDDIFLKKISAKREFNISRKIAASIESFFCITVPIEEIGYITMHLLGTRNQYYTGGTPFIPNFQLVQLAKRIIKIAQDETGQKLVYNEKLLIGLVNHLGPSISRLQMGMEIRNPLLADIKKDYDPLMRLSRICCVALQPIVKNCIPESEIAYIAMHLGAALENTQLTGGSTKYYVAIACPTGLGSSKLLASRIKHEFNNIKIVNVISALRINNQNLSDQQIDFIISTVSISDISIPIVVVNPLLKAMDINVINNFLTNFKHKTQKHFPSFSDKIPFTKKILHLTCYQKAILHILSDFIFLDLADVFSVNDIITIISRKISDIKATPNIIADSLHRRERYGSTLLYEQKIILLHCQASVAHCHFAIIRAKQGISLIEKKSSTVFIAAVIMIIPDTGEDETRQTMGAITKSLVDNWLFSSAIANYTEKEIKHTLEGILKTFLKEKIDLLLN